jgi:hypothetical protein
MDRFTELRDVLGKSASAHDYLKRYAIEGRLRPGRRLIPSDLEKHFGISATPIRDALVRLAAEGFLTWEPSRGFFSKPFSLEEQCDLNHILIIAIPACWDRSGGSSPTTVLEAAIVFQVASQHLLTPTRKPKPKPGTTPWSICSRWRRTRPITTC